MSITQNLFILPAVNYCGQKTLSVIVKLTPYKSLSSVVN